MPRIDVHQHLWSQPLLDSLRARDELPFVRDEHGLVVLYLPGERPYVIDASAETAAARESLLDDDGADSALLCISSPLGIEALPREQALAMIGAFLDGADELGPRFGAWGPVALDGAGGEDVEDLLDRGCCGVSLPAGALADLSCVERLHGVLSRLEELEAPLFVHPGPGRSPRGASCPSLRDPLWWPALTSYVAQMQQAWMALAVAGRARHPQLRVVFAMLAGLAPLQAERLRARGWPRPPLEDELLFYETSSYGPTAAAVLGALVGDGQLLYGSDRPVAEPGLAVCEGPFEADVLEAAMRAAFAGMTLPSAGRGLALGSGALP